MQKILLPFDGSEHALRAISYAATLAQKDPSLELELLHVLDPMTLRSHAGLTHAEISRLYSEEAAAVLAAAQ